MASRLLFPCVGSAERLLSARSRGPRCANEPNRTLRGQLQWRPCGRHISGNPNRPVPSRDQILVNMLTRLAAFSAHGRGIFTNHRSPPSMWKALVPVACILLAPVIAEAHPHHHYRHHHLTYRHQYLNSMASIAGDTQVSERVVGGRPSGCPHAFCGCEASLYKFGRIIPELNLAANWRRFPRTAPASGMAAVRSGHVMILQQQVAGNIWLVHDGNSGGHATREHPRSIAGYTIVDPSSGSSALSLSSAGASPFYSKGRTMGRRFL